MFSPPKIPVFRNLITAKQRWSTWWFLCAFMGYSAVCIFIYFQYVEPWIAGDIVTRIGADSDRYWDAARNQGSQSLVSLTGNFLGPVSLVLILHSGFAVMCFNFLLFFIAMGIAASIPGVNPAVLGTLLLLNAELIPSLTTLNKEILALFSSVLIAKYLYVIKPTAIALFGVLLVSLFARWEQAAILVICLFLRRVFPGRPRISLAFVVVAITVAYPLAFRLLGVDPNVFDWLMEGAHTILVLNKIQNAFGFPVVVVPKIIMLMGGMLVSPSFYAANPGLADGFSDPQQELFQPLGCVALICVFVYAIWTKRMSLNRPIGMFVALTLIVTAATPFIQPRYLFGVYVMLCIELARPRQLYGEQRSSLLRIKSYLAGSRSGVIPYSGATVPGPH